MSDEVKDPEGLLKAYEQAKADLVELRATLKELEAEKDTLQSERDQFETEITDFRSNEVKSQVLEALKAQNVRNPESLVKYMDLTAVSKDEKGKLVGLDDAIKEVKNDFPERFIARKAAAGTNADIHAEKPVETSPGTGTEQQINRLFSTRA